MGMCELGGKLYVVGGARNAFDMLRTCYFFDPALNTWSTLAPMPTARRSLGVFVRGGCIYAVGGKTNSGFGASAAVERYDPVTNSWTTVRSLPAATEYLNCCTVPIEQAAVVEHVNDPTFADLIGRAKAVGR
jgi:N-acetylneuraminic acid mutarotase